MDRRTFCRLSLAAPLALEALAAEALAEPPLPRLPVFEISGGYREIGAAIGRHFRDRIRAVLERRRAWLQNLLDTLSSPRGRRLSDELRRATRTHFPHLVEELEGMAEGAGLHRRAIWAIAIKSELEAVAEDTPGCSTLFLQNKRGAWLAHNEDGHVAYLGEMGVVRVAPPSGVRFVAMVYPGTLTGNGPCLNDRGVVQTTNYIGTTRPRPGVPRYVISRAILEASSLDEARQIATVTPRAHPWRHNLAGFTDGQYLSLETVPGKAHERRAGGLYIHTNHLLHPETSDYPDENEEYKAGSSMSRYRVLTELARKRSAEDLGPDDLLAMLSSHRSAPYSPCRHPAGEVEGQTLGTALYDLRLGSFLLYSGNPCRAVPQGRPLELRL